MFRDLPFIGVTLSPELKANSDWYTRAFLKGSTPAPVSETPTSLFTSIGDRTYSFNTRRGRTYELGTLESGECSLGVDNSDGYLDPNNSSSSLFPNVVPFRPITITAAYPLTGNLLNDTNLAPVIPADAPSTWADYRVSVGANDSNFELGALSNWRGGGVSVVSTTAHSGTYSMRVINSATAQLDVPTVAGKTVTISYWYKHTGATTYSSLKAYDGAYLAQSPLGLSVASNNSSTWTRQNFTVTPSSPKILIQVTNVGGSAGVYLDDIQIEFGSSAGTNVTTGPSVYYLFNGFVERYPQTYQAPNRGQVNLVATDALASMSQVNLNNVYSANLLNDSAVAIYYYPLDEQAESVSAFNAGVYQQAALEKIIFNNYDYPITFGNDSAKTGVIGAGGTGVNFHALENPSDVYASGAYLTNKSVQDVTFKNSGDTYTFNLWAQLNYGNVNDLLFAVNLDSVNSGFNTGSCFGIRTTSIGKFSAWVPAFGIYGDQNLAVSASAASIGAWYFLSLKVTYNGGTSYDLALTVNDQTVTATGVTLSAGIDVRNVVIGGSGAPTTDVGTVLSNVSIHRGAINPAQYYYLGAYAQLTQTATPEQSGVRFANMITDLSGFNSLPVSADLGVSQIQQSSYSDASLTSVLQTISDSEGGFWFVDGEGFVTFKDRHNRLQKLSPSVVFGDGAGETPFQGGAFILDYDPTYIFNEVQVHRVNGVAIVEQDTESISNYFLRSYNKTVSNGADSETADLANFLLSRYKDPHARPEAITLTPVRNPAIWNVALGVEVGDLVRVNKRPIGAPAISIDCFIERVEHSFDAQTADWITTIALSPAFVYYWNLSGIRGTTNSTGSAGTFTVTKGSYSAGGIVSARDLIPGQMIQWTASGTTYLGAIINTPTETSTTVTAQYALLNQFTTGSNYASNVTTLTSNILLDSTASATVADSLTVTSGYFLIGSEIIAGSLTGGVLTITGRAQFNTKQDAGGTIDLATSTSYSHYSGAPVYYISSAPASVAIASGTVISEVLPNQVTRKPYAVASITQDNYSVLGSWIGVLNSGSYSTTTPASGIKYNTFILNPLTDKNNFPQSDVSTGQMLSIGSESVAVAQADLPTSTGSWNLYAYKIADSGKTISADLTIDGTTVTSSSAITASAILVGNEFMQVTAGSGTTSLTVTRGTPDLVAWGILSLTRHYSGEKIYTITNAGCSGTYQAYNQVIEGYNSLTAVSGSARLGF